MLDAEIIEYRKQILDYAKFLLKENEKMNLIGKSTVDSVWDRHIKDCLQIMKFIKNKDVKVADLGSGAGLPGILLSICGVKEVHLFEKSPKKCNFLEKCKRFSTNKIIIRNVNLNDYSDNSFNIITSRALGSLNMLLDISKKLKKDDGALIFLKGKKVYDEITEAKKKHKFEYVLHNSETSDEGKIVVIARLE
ncbi:MAG: 16S rRNA (guanine(527)-N(7))-methyltransferase RsmG [Rickettsiales bacterium]|jgi:16S rRNA (guanine527-N7)-methyltransferase|nr:16S rRNA (guanine(527)-N(7))-methyltransferase RsmG [Rickettsiales bacterium]